MKRSIVTLLLAGALLAAVAVPTAAQAYPYTLS